MKKIYLLLQQLTLPSSKSGYFKLAGAIFSTLILLLILVNPSADAPEKRVALPVTEKPAEKAMLPAPPNAENSKIILELFSPSDASIHQQQAEAPHEQKIEQTMTVTFVLTKCQLLSQDDYSTIYQALVRYATHVGLGADAAAADARVRQIAESSSTSYALVYSRTSCESEALPVLAKDILNWANALLKQE